MSHFSNNLVLSSKSPSKHKKAGKKAPEPSAREKAIQFAKNVPKPKMAKGDRKESDNNKSPRLASSPFKEEFDKLE